MSEWYEHTWYTRTPREDVFVDWGFHKGGGSPWFCEECEEEIKLPDENVTEIVGHDGLDLDYHHP